MKNIMRHKHEEGMERCPLMGASKAISMIDGAYMLVIGTEECGGYTKSLLSMKGMGSNCFSVVLDNHDVTFGSAEKVEAAVTELMEEYNPQSLYLVTTCVVEIIGDDFSDIARRAEEKYSKSVKIISTNHFSGDGEMEGMNKVFQTSGSGKMPNKFNMMMRKMKGGNMMDRSKRMEMMEARRGGRI